ncbi:MAG: amino acid adenylation domain-containing protein [Clostridia bacterium]|nr:amino acid adenylation domain-containing protein [Clostridia bacterium]
MENTKKNIDQLTIEEKRAMIEELLRKKAGLIDKTYPLSYGQKALWFINESSPESTAYNIAFAIRINSEINIELLKKALQTLVDRHEVLRTIYPKKDGNPVQIVKGYQKLNFEEFNIGWADEIKIKELTAQFNRKPFDLENGPIMRTALFKLNLTESILVLSVHHIACDFSSLMVLQKEMFITYYGLQNGRGDTLPKPAFQFNDFREWQDSIINSPAAEQLLDYWKSQFEGDLPVLELVTDKQRPDIQTFNGGVVPFQINREVSAKLKRLAQNKGVTMFTLLLSSFQILLHRYTNQNEAVVGIPLSGRNGNGFESVVGYLINMAPIRARFTDNPTFDQFLKQMKDTVLNAMKHGEYPFPLLVEKLQPQRVQGRSPVFQVTFELLKYQQMVSETFQDDLKISPFEVPQQDGQFDIMLSLSEMPDKFVGVFMYNTDLFEAATIERLVENFLVLLNGIIDNPDQGIDELPIISEWDKERLLKDWNNTEREFDKDSFVHHLFEEQVKRNPSALAVSSYDGKMTYEELNDKANRVAHYLKSLGMGLDKKIGICLNPSMDMIVALLGVLKSGATYVAIDPGYPAQRIEYIIKDAGIEVILTAHNIEIPEGAGEITRIDIDVSQHILESQDSHNPNTVLSPQNIAYILYTSGSTGNPKGVAIYHLGMMNYLTWCAQEYIKPEDNTDRPASFAYLPLVFDASITSIYTPLITGRYLLIPQKQGLEIFSDPDIQKGGFSFVKLTPAHLSLLKESFDKKMLNGFAKRLIIGGEALLPEQLAYFKQCDLEWTIINEYGPTETVVGSTVYCFSVKDDVPKNVPIGKPIMNTRIYILNSQNQPTPVGVVGEIAIGGIGVSKGYVNREDLTREKFIPDPFSPGDNNYVYKTGDLGRWLPDGNLEYFGRMDYQVKIRGYRIELGEIEAVLAGSFGVKNAAVVIQETKTGDKQLVGYYVSEINQTSDEQEIISCLKSRLPDYMVPTMLVKLDAIPLTHNGKVDRALLSKLSSQTISCKDNKVLMSPLEEELAELWKQVLNVETVGKDDGFTKLGGHSLLAVQLISKIRQKFEKNIPVMELYPNGTIRRIADLLGENRVDVQNEKKGPVLMKKGKGDSKNIFMIHPGTGNIDMYPALCKLLTDEFNCWGLSADKYKLSIDSSIGVKDLASEYLDAVRTIQKDGPYYILGWCTGGTIAFEMIRQLEEQGVKPGTFCMISSVAPREDLGELMKEVGGLDTLLEGLNTGKVSLDQALSVLPVNIQLTVAADGIQTMDKLMEYLKFYKNLHDSRVRYSPDSSIATALHYFNPDKTFIDPGEWERYCKGSLIIHGVTGEHDTLFQEPYISKLAEALNEVLKENNGEGIKRCTKCTLPETFPNIQFDSNGVCNYCTKYDEAAIKKARYKIESESELIKNLQKFKRKDSRYDVLIPLSGGVDSSVTLIRIVEKFNLRVLAFHNDHGYEDDTATENVKKLCKAMNVDLIIKQQDLGFMKKLWRYTHEAKSRGLSSCFVCGGIIYANSLEVAERYNIPIVINGYSKGQADMMADKENALEAWTGLLEEFQKDTEFFQEFMSKQEPMKKQIVFKGKQDFENELSNEQMLVIPFYLFDFYKTDKEKLKSECIKRFDWKPMKHTYPSRTTNCTMVWLNTYVDICKIGYTMYDEEYAGIVRGGDMTRAQAISDLAFNPPEGLIEQLAKEIGTDLSKCK